MERVRVWREREGESERERRELLPLWPFRRRFVIIIAAEKSKGRWATE